MQVTQLRDDAALQRLIAALKKATGPDVGGCLLAAIRFAQAAKWIDREAAAYARNLVAHGASLDAALTLVPEGYVWRMHPPAVGQNGKWVAETFTQPMWGSCREGKHPTSPALALCIAALRARAAA